MAAPSYSKVNQARTLWDESHSILPPLPPTSKKSPGRPGAGLQRVQPPGASKPGRKQNLLEPAPLSSGRRRSMSFDDVYLQQALAAQGQSNRSSGVPRSRVGTNYSRQMPLGHVSSIKEWDTWSEGGPVSNRERSSTLLLPGISSHRDHAGEVRIRHPVLSVYKRNAYRNHTDSCSSLNSKGFDFSYFGRNRRGRNRHQSSEEKEVKYENTYRMEPKTNFHLAEGRIRRMMEDYLKGTLHGLSANKSATASEAAHAAKGLVESIKHQVKLLQLQRYKIICLATICLKSGQDLVSSSRCVWDTQTDGFLSVTNQNKDWFGEVTVYAVYKE